MIIKDIVKKFTAHKVDKNMNLAMHHGDKENGVWDSLRINRLIMSAEMD